VASFDSGARSLPHLAGATVVAFLSFVVRKSTTRRRRISPGGSAVGGSHRPQRAEALAQKDDRDNEGANGIGPVGSNEL
jgi:hypothetical protein